jgi:hypothetical protein
MVAVGNVKGLTVTEVLAVVVHPLASVTIKLYVPDAAVVTFNIEGFCRLEVYPFGPVQLKI